MLKDVPFGEIDLRALAERRGPERAFLSLYLSGADALGTLDHRIRKVRALLHDEEAELEYFEENLKLVQAFLDAHPPNGTGVCVFACWALDWVEGYPLDRAVPDLLWVDAAPYIRPLAELQDEYENFVVVALDNTDARVYLVTSAEPDDEARVKGDVKNDVKVGGWSQKRYERRRDKELKHYAKEIADVLAGLHRSEPFDRIFLLGTDETIRELEAVLPEPVADKVAATAPADLHEDDAFWQRAFALFEAEERAAEESLWERVKGEYLRGGRAATGPADVLAAAAVGRVQALILTRDAKLPGLRCRACENVSAGTPEVCPICGEADVFTVDLANDLVELVERSGGRAEFADPIPGLAEAGDVAALLRY
ncbi:MAG: Vms1/Ankzf1 family peptidyl-tRNA hydrolase [Rhodothermales bacterium]|nr:Vms1/Ankzf1 family peptidyl-tRNA hydrolase [Rhodothermales bacterium]